MNIIKTEKKVIKYHVTVEDGNRYSVYASVEDGSIIFHVRRFGTTEISKKVPITLNTIEKAVDWFRQEITKNVSVE